MTNQTNATAAFNAGHTSVVVDHAASPKAIVIFAHGAGADKSHAFMSTVSQYLVEHNISVLRFNFPYMDKRLADAKKRPPDRMPKLLACYLQHIKQLNDHFSAEQLAQLPLFIGGKSMGSRVAATITSETLASELKEDMPLTRKVAGTFCLGYPFYPIGKPEKTRLAPIVERSVDNSILIVQGSRDKLGDEQAIKRYDLPAHCQIIFLEDGDHDFKPRVKSGFNHDQHIRTAAKTISDYIDKVTEKLTLEKSAHD
ncbi:hypothetical protein DXX93_07655 [Thalassotalea euphylliae]|uniref:KANL3/Tex30 alpha/beta hydrolase-like domain-containing protein n=1 Tax=Thalassotalea euphylliae TaxID=1655234 RepID=A0A3E0TPJ4_9GAMM|nr:alpha/beta family hydrolase [Thalassotalea euphylliae]REL26469.1 hypothetical protein DXX93_07655 [Thalassotalea euphylliae]